MTAARRWISASPRNCGHDLRQWRTRALIAGVAGPLLSAAGFFLVSPDQFFRSYLWSYMFILGADPRAAGVAHAAIPHRRRLGRGDPPPCEAATRTLPLVLAAVPADRDRHP